jgi:ergothioneine biosynthesis protein EgtB
MESHIGSERRPKMVLHRQTECMETSARMSANECAPATPLGVRYGAIRARTESLCEPLAVEDYGVQSMPDASPAKWHLAHTSWFFETFVLKRTAGYRPFHPQYELLFNSYYNTVGAQYPRPRRGLLSRPTVEEIYRYRAHVDDEIGALLAGNGAAGAGDLHAVLELGLQHEQQHQELILTDLKHLFSCNPLRPVYRPRREAVRGALPAAGWVPFPGGVCAIGHPGAGFAFDNETPRHRVFLEPFALASQLVTNGDFLAFIDDGGYQRPELWLSDGWDTLQSQGWSAPLYWESHGTGWMIGTLSGPRELDLSEPVCHVSYYEADAFARWAGARLPREGEWEVAAAARPIDGNFVEGGRFHPAPPALDAPPGLPAQLFGDVWEWTQSPYVPYPGYRPPAGALGEYNAKFMSSQMVLRGGSCASPRAHLRPSYRNFFPPAARWQFSGLRLARDEG